MHNFRSVTSPMRLRSVFPQELFEEFVSFLGVSFIFEDVSRDGHLPAKVSQGPICAEAVYGETSQTCPFLLKGKTE